MPPVGTAGTFGRVSTRSESAQRASRAHRPEGSKYETSQSIYVFKPRSVEPGKRRGLGSVRSCSLIVRQRDEPRSNQSVTTDFGETVMQLTSIIPQVFLRERG